MTVERGQVDLEGDKEQEDRDDDQDARDDPERRSQLLPAPARQLATVLGDSRRLWCRHLFDVAHDGRPETKGGKRQRPTALRRQERVAVLSVMQKMSLVADQSSR